MKKITRNELLKLQKENSELKLFNEYYTRSGKSNKMAGMQVLKGWALEHTSKNNDLFYEVEGGYATEFIYNKYFKNN